jgi:hypothetical protein
MRIWASQECFLCSLQYIRHSNLGVFLFLVIESIDKKTFNYRTFTDTLQEA